MLPEKDELNVMESVRVRLLALPLTELAEPLMVH